MFFVLGALLQLVVLAHAQTVYLAGDSTMAKNGAGSGTGTDGKSPGLCTFREQETDSCNHSQVGVNILDNISTSLL